MKHALVRAVGSAQKASNDGDVNDLSSLLFEEAQILDGEVPDDPAAFAARLNRLVVRRLGAATGAAPTADFTKRRTRRASGKARSARRFHPGSLRTGGALCATS